jgi:regulator of PEP synthase PpsR (kinase-PPPase family)
LDQVVETRTFYIVSDASGEAASYLVSRALEQYAGSTVEQRFPNVGNETQIAQIMHAAEEVGAMVMFTFGDESMRATARTAAEGRGVMYVDLFDPLMAKIGQWLGKEPRNRPGHAYDTKYFERLKAFDFYSNHDDGKRIDELGKADIVIIGLSRASKSPVCRQLADHRIKAANIPIVPGVELPVELDKVDPQKVYILRIGLERLLTVRQSRTNVHSPESGDPYVDRECVKEEIIRVNRLIARQKDWTAIDVTNRNVEETAAMILSSHQKRFPPK